LPNFENEQIDAAVAAGHADQVRWLDDINVIRIHLMPAVRATKAVCRDPNDVMRSDSVGAWTLSAHDASPLFAASMMARLGRNAGIERAERLVVDAERVVRAFIVFNRMP
jgi:hypothetical protein